MRSRDKRPDPDEGITTVMRVVRAGHDGDASSALEGLHHPDDRVRASSLGALTRLGRAEILAAPDVGRSLIDAASDPSPAVRRRAALEAGPWSCLPDAAEPVLSDLVTVLVELLDDSDHRVAEVAAFACGEVVPEGSARDAAVRALCRVSVDHEEHLCREAAVAALGSIGDPSGLDAVLSACSDRASVRRRAVLALAAFDDPAAAAEMRRLAQDRDLQVRQAAEELLAIESGETT